MAAASRFRFGIFQFDVSTGDLRREGQPVRLQGQPAQVLGLLLAHRSEIVTRETLRQAVWGNDTFVDFDRGLNFCISQIRSALGDSAESPRFVRTVPKRGYQFIAPVETLDAVGAVPENSVTAPAPRKLRRNLIATAAMLLVGGAGFTVLRWWPAPPVTRIAVTRFDNETGDPALDRLAQGLTDSVIAELTNSAGGEFGIIGNAAILQKPRKDRDLLAIANTLQANFVVLGQLQGDPAHPRMLAHLIRLPDQTHLMVTRREDVNLTAPEALQTELAHAIALDFIRRLHSPLPPSRRKQ